MHSDSATAAREEALDALSPFVPYVRSRNRETPLTVTMVAMAFDGNAPILHIIADDGRIAQVLQPESMENAVENMDGLVKHVEKLILPAPFN